MDSAAPFLDFQRTSVAEQAAAALRASISQGKLGDPLPGEHQLARMLGISRSSLRAAMTRLGAEGLIVRVNGRRARLQPQRWKPRPPPPPVVRMICPLSRRELNPHEHPILMEMRAGCAAKGIGWEEYFDARLDRPDPKRQLEALVDGRRNTCWILLSCPERIQRWFVARAAPALVLGSCAPGILLPSVDTAYRAVGQHAAALLLRHGHRRIAMLQPARSLAGDVAARDGFFGQLAAGAADTVISSLSLDRDPAVLATKLDRLAASPRRPTAFFSTHPEIGLGALFQLQRSGLRFPEDASFILGESHPLIDAALPQITRYRSEAASHADRAVRIAQSLLGGRKVPAAPTLFFPTLVPGRTLGPARDRPPV